MSSKALSPVCNAQLFNNQGNMLSGGTITVYYSGTLTLANIYANAAGGALPNPIVLNASGRIPNGQLFLDLGKYYDIQVKSGTTVLESYSNIAGLLDSTNGVLGSITIDSFVGDGIANRFILSTTPDAISITTVIVNGLILTPNIDYSILSNTIIFSVPPTNGDQIAVRYSRVIGSQPEFQRDRIYNSWSTVSGQLDYTLDKSPGALPNLMITLDGLVLKPLIDYTWIGTAPTTLTLVSDPLDGKELTAVYGDTTPIADDDAAAIRYFTNGGINTRYVSDKLGEIVSVKDFGAVGDGIADDTAAIQAALYSTMSNGNPINAGKTLLFNAGTYKVTSTLITGSNQTIIFDSKVVINLIPSTNIETTSLFVNSNQNNFFIIGNGCTFNGTVAGATIEGNAAGLYIYGSDNVHISNVNINSFATDGITLSGDITGSGPCTNVTIQDVIASGSRRNNLSIISATNTKIIGGSYSNAGNVNKTSGGPWAGIDIEPNQDCFIEDVVLIGVKTSGNAGAGIQITPGELSNTTGKRFHVNIIGGRSLNDGNINGIPGLYFVNGFTQTNKIFGEISVNGFSVDQPLSSGVLFSNWDADKSPRVILDKVTVYNPDSTNSGDTNFKKTGYVVLADPSQVITNLGNIILRDCLAEDIRPSPVMSWGFFIGADSGKTVKNVRIDNPITINQTATAKYDVNTSITGVSTTGALNGVDVNYVIPKNTVIAGSGDITSYGGSRITPTASGFSLTLPSASNCNGMHYEIQNAASINSTTISIQSTDTIMWYGSAISTGIVLDEGGYVKIRSINSNTWLVEQISGEWRRFGRSFKRQIEYGTAIPTTGTWAVGDRVFNGTPAIGSPKSWVCTVAGSPGTWVSEGNL